MIDVIWNWTISVFSAFLDILISTKLSLHDMDLTQCQFQDKVNSEYSFLLLSCCLCVITTVLIGGFPLSSEWQQNILWLFRSIFTYFNTAVGWMTPDSFSDQFSKSLFRKLQQVSLSPSGSTTFSTVKKSPNICQSFSFLFFH